MKQAFLSIALESLAAAGQPLPTEFRLFAAGTSDTSKGEFRYTERSVRECAAFNARRGIDCVIDWEHASLFAKYAPNPAEAGKAAGWFQVEARTDGLFATNVSWTKAGSSALSSREFRYFSPVILFDEETHEITAVINAALTNNPASFGQKPLVASQAPDEHPKHQEPKPMLKTAIIAALALSIDTTDNQAIAALEQLKREKENASREREQLLSLTGKSSVSEASGVIAAWKASADQVASLSAKLSEFETRSKASEVKGLVDAALKDGKATPAQAEMLTAMGTKDIEMLKGYLSVAVKVLPTPASAPGGAPVETVLLSAEDKEVAALFGVSDLKTLAAVKQTLKGTTTTAA